MNIFSQWEVKQQKNNKAENVTENSVIFFLSYTGCPK